MTTPEAKKTDVADDSEEDGYHRLGAADYEEGYWRMCRGLDKTKKIMYAVMCTENKIGEPIVAHAFPTEEEAIKRNKLTEADLENGDYVIMPVVIQE